MNIADYPQRIVCLTEETTETLYLLGESDRIVGVSGYTARPPEARQKPHISAFTTAKFDKIMQLEPDLVLAFSDLQRDLVRELIGRGLNVLTFNQRSVGEILQMILTLSRIVGVPEKGIALIDSLNAGLKAVEISASRFPCRPRVFFEEWNEPLISGIRWVDELIEVAGGTSLFPELRTQGNAKERIIDPLEAARRDPEVVIASWCGKKVNKRVILSRPGWGATSAVQNEHVYEVKSTYILQPGPAALTEGVRQLHAILATVVQCTVPADARPTEKLDAAIASSQ
jgi:iron complex transport system substrate-binding protein